MIALIIIARLVASAIVAVFAWRTLTGVCVEYQDEIASSPWPNLPKARATLRIALLIWFLGLVVMLGAIWL